MAERLVLTGFMGSGKTAVGKRVASKLGWEFLDTDAEAEREAGMSISEIFAVMGEPAFRELEEEIVLKALRGKAPSVKGLVLSLGGGAVTSPLVRQALESEPLVALLDLDVDTAFERASGGGRPLARDRVVFRQLFEQREELYRRIAGFIVDARGRSVGGLADEIVAAVKERTGIR